ncbi:hypothetical protein [Pseudofrankia sp. BMG5.36]|uniref:hypothetical protein n=1 Tax=Pseudofrankia sp. BMG5.36 TaxID=1834512 RepID=UPI0008DA0199|nr:hypothetical protein [Pseudofrankia sp. BMG5.36]OHV74740.1 hypothetical protein BCD48_31865 [Pseudofrankia sp. BMG5.36]
MTPRADEEVNRTIDALMDRLHDFVSGRIGDDPALTQLEREAADGIENPLTEKRVELSLANAAAQDATFAQELERLVSEIRAANQDSAPKSTVNINAHGHDQAQMPIQGQGVQDNRFGFPGGSR